MQQTINKNKLKDKTETCDLSGVDLKEAPELKDVDRIVPKAEGGEITKDNVRVVDPVEHMKLHGNYREREGDYETLRALIDDRNQIVKLHVKINNQKMAYLRRTDNPSGDSIEILDETYGVVSRRLKDIDAKVKKLIKKMSKNDSLVAAVLTVKGAGELTIANLINYFDFDGTHPETDPKTGKTHPKAGQRKAANISSLWKYCGYHVASYDRHQKGVAGGGNKILRSLLYNTACSMIKCNSPYREIYDREKEKLSVSKKMTKSRNSKGVMVECMWKDTMPNHRHMAAIRKMIKIFLSHFWVVARTLRNEPVTEPFVKEKLGHTTIITPEEMGWEY